MFLHFSADKKALSAASLSRIEFMREVSLCGREIRRGSGLGEQPAARPNHDRLV